MGINVENFAVLSSFFVVAALRGFLSVLVISQDL
jgi:hypothetical protein